MRTSTFFLVIFGALSAIAQRPYELHLQQPQLLAIAECSTTNCVDAVLERAPYVDPPLRLIAASRVAQLDATVARQALFDALPHDPVAFWFCYSVTSPSLGTRFKGVRQLYDLYFPAAADAAATSGENIRDFLLLQAFADGEMAAAVAEEVASIKKRNPTAYCRAVKTLQPSVTRHLPSCAPPAERTK